MAGPLAPAVCAWSVQTRIADDALSVVSGRPPFSPVNDNLEFELKELFQLPLVVGVSGLPEGWVAKGNPLRRPRHHRSAHEFRRRATSSTAGHRAHKSRRGRHGSSHRRTRGPGQVVSDRGSSRGSEPLEGHGVGRGKRALPGWRLAARTAIARRLSGGRTLARRLSRAAPQSRAHREPRLSGTPGDADGR